MTKRWKEERVKQMGLEEETSQRKRRKEENRERKNVPLV
jgi:hypothetical protein